MSDTMLIEKALGLACAELTKRLYCPRDLKENPIDCNDECMALMATDSCWYRYFVHKAAMEE